MSHLAVQITEYIATAPITARQLEEKAGLPRMTIGNILNDTHPRPERFGQLLRAVDDATARRWLTAYLRDDCPTEFLPRLEIIIADPQGTDATMHEQSANYRSTPDHGPSAVLAAWTRLQSAIAADTNLARWFIKTVQLILGPA
jgi:hypothetical protein